MTRAEAKRAALTYCARVLDAQGSDNAVAGFLRVPLWVGDQRHPDVIKVTTAVEEIITELRRRGGRR